MRLHFKLRFDSVGLSAVALLPVVLTAVPGFLSRKGICSLDWLSVIAAALYLPLWFTVGRTAEVRVYIPFLLLLCPVAARVFAATLDFHEDAHHA